MSARRATSIGCSTNSADASPWCNLRTRVSTACLPSTATLMPLPLQSNVAHDDDGYHAPQTSRYRVFRCETACKLARRLSPVRALTLALVLVGLAGCASASPKTTTTTVSTTVTQAASAPTTAPRVHSFQAGNGTQNVGTIHIEGPAVIRWTCSCASFALVSHPDGGNAIAISSTAQSGSSDVAPGAYPDAQVIANGDWTIRIVAQ
jgi:hypothetical protein